uniref:Uncharacterized protein n=1 Tax=Opuntia streptacantha TaxID=393608 RepID=A0A7C9AJN9_OPUST
MVNSFTMPSISIELPPGVFSTPLFFIILLTFLASSHISASPYIFANRTYMPLSSGSNSSSFQAAFSPIVTFPCMRQAKNRAPHTTASGSIGMLLIRASASCN